MATDCLQNLYAEGLISSLDMHFAALMERLNGASRRELAVAAALVSSTTRQGHICLELQRAGEAVPACREWSPDLEGWAAELRRTGVVGEPGEFRPLILDSRGRLYLYRYWHYQEQLAQGLKARIEDAPPLAAGADLGERLERLFPSRGDGPDWQKIAALAGIWKSFCVISGGPGTGKTTTVAKLLALLIEQEPSRRLRIALAAPTGKAAARLQETLKAAKAHLPCSEAVRQLIPEEAATIHRLLGSIPGSPFFRHNRDNPLALDVLIVDEASMVDLPLMSKLLQALPPKARLILLGDKDQLSSVEAGAVLGDICETGGRALFSREFAEACGKLCGGRPEDRLVSGTAGSRSKDCIIELRKSYRFSGESGIASLSRAVRSSAAGQAAAVLQGGRYDDLAWHELPSGKMLERAVKEEVLAGYGAYLKAAHALRDFSEKDPSAALQQVFALFEEFRILCAVREGPCGVGAVNLLVENLLEAAGLLRRGRVWYPGRPVLIKRNDYNLRLFNGDIGIVLPVPGAGADLRVFFPGSEGRFRAFHPLRLPDHETVYAMTIHKSQGSEFDHVLLVLPDRDAPVLTRELIYTGITRAKKKASLWGSLPVLRTAVSRCTKRLSGLSEALWGAAAVSSCSGESS